MSRSFVSLIFLAILVAMLAVTTWASLDRNVLVAARELWADPWGRATIFDAYFGFLVVWLWIAWREPRVLTSVLWGLALLALGNIAIAVYVLLALRAMPPGTRIDELFRQRGLR